MKTILVVDDESLFTESLAMGLPALAPSLLVLTASNGLEARAVLESQEVDLVLTDLRMPVLDGFELVAYMTRHQPHVPVLVVTAFGAPDVGPRLRELGIDAFIEKPVSVPSLVARIEAELARSASGYVRGIALPTFLQMLEIEQKTCIVTVEADGRTGTLHFVEGQLWDAEADGRTGEEAASVIVSWKEPSIALGFGPRPHAPRIKLELRHLLLETLRLQDEEELGGHELDALREDPDVVLRHEAERNAVEKLMELTSLDGFVLAGVFSPLGERLALVSSAGPGGKELGSEANELLLSAKRVAERIGASALRQVHLDASPVHLLAVCHDEGSGPGRCHVHVVLAISSESGLGVARLRLAATVQQLVPDFRL